MNATMNTNKTFLQRLGQLLSGGAAPATPATAPTTPTSHVQAVAELSAKDAADGKPMATTPEDEKTATNETVVEVEIDDDEEDDDEENSGTPEKAEPDMSTPPTAEGDVAQAPPSASDSDGAGADSGAENNAGAPQLEEDTMAENQNQGATAPSTRANAGGNGAAAGAPENPTTKTKATVAEMKAAFPSDPMFALECIEKNMSIAEAKALAFDQMQAKNAEQAQKAAALGNNGKGAKAPLASLGRPITGNAAADRESVMHTLAGSASTDPRGKLIAAGLMDSITGKVGPVASAERLGYDGIVGTYMDAGLTFAEASREAQTHHREHWNAKREELAESYSGKAQARESRVRSGAGR